MRQLHSASAAAAITLVLCVACFSFLVFVLLPAVAAMPGNLHPTVTIASPSVQIRNITRGALLILLLGYVVGILGWIAAFAARRDGMHRLNLLLSERQLRLRLR
jgi:hypothetical protein